MVTFLEMCLSTFPRGNPRRGFPLRKGPLGPFSNPFLRLPKATKAAGASPPHPYKFFEKNLTKNFYVSLPSLSAGF